MKKITLKQAAPFALLSIVALASIFAPNLPMFVDDGKYSAADIAWIIVATALVFLMTPGLAFFYGGMVHRKNVISTMMKSVVAAGIVSVLWVTVGFSLSFGSPIGFTINGTHYGVIGNPLDFAFFDQVEALPNQSLGTTIPFILFALFQMKFAVILLNYESSTPH